MRVHTIDRAGLNTARTQEAGHTPPPVAEDPLGADNLMSFLRGLAVGHSNRVFGTEEGGRAAEWIAAEMRALGLEPGHGGSYLQPFRWPVGGMQLGGRNVLGLIRGTDPELKDEVVLVTAHYDSQEGTQQGANDNASGVAAMLAIAQTLAKEPPKRSVLFVAFDGEEGLRRNGKYNAGRRGSRYYAEAPAHPIEKTAMIVNLDMIGQVHLESGPRTVIYQWSSRDPFARDVLEVASRKNNLGKNVDGYPEQPEEAQFFTTDAEPLYRRGVPTINFLSGRDIENHSKLDALERIIPERVEQYARRAHQCVVEAANRAETLDRLGIAPGGLMPTYPLVRARKAATSIPDEEWARLAHIEARLPRFRDLAFRLVDAIRAPELRARIQQRTGIDIGGAEEILNEPFLHRVRVRRMELIEAYHRVDKQDIAERKALISPILILAGVEEVLSGALYVTRLHSTGDYYLQQIPERLGEMRRGAKRLDLAALTEGVIGLEDTGRFTAPVNADRAVSLARASVDGLDMAIGQAVYALVDPSDAAISERPVEEQDRRKVELDMGRAARAALQANGASHGREGDGTKLLGTLRAFFDRSLGHVRGSGERWLERFAAKNALTNFARFVDGLALQGAEAAEIRRRATALDDALSRIDLGRLEGAVASFYASMTTLAFGPEGRRDTIEDIAALGREDVLERTMLARLEEVRGATDAKAIGEASEVLEVRRLRDVGDLVARALDLADLFDSRDRKNRSSLSESSTLKELKSRIDRARDSASVTTGAAGIAEELQFWSRWLEPFVALEPAAEFQANERREIAETGLLALEELWATASKNLSPALGLSQMELRSVSATRGVLSERLMQASMRKVRDVAAELAFKNVEPIFEAQSGLKELLERSSMTADLRFHQAARAIGFRYAGAHAAETLEAISRRLDALKARSDVRLGRNERSGPMAVLSIRGEQNALLRRGAGTVSGTNDG